MNRSLKIPNLEVFDETEEGKFDVVHVRSITPAARVCNLGCDPGLNGHQPFFPLTRKRVIRHSGLMAEKRA